MKTLTIQERENILEELKDILSEEMGDKIMCAIAYGSTLNDDFYYNSDFDILIVASNPDIQFLKKLKDIKANWLKKGIRIDFNVHSETDIPSVRKELFWHNNRGIYVQKELELYGRLLIGKNIFKIEKIDTEQLLSEAVRVINSLLYQTRKVIINSPLGDNDKVLIMKWCIYGALYALASRGVFIANRKLALQKFYEVFNPPIHPEIFLHIKVNRADKISGEDLNAAYDFLSYLDKRILEDYVSSKAKH